MWEALFLASLGAILLLPLMPALTELVRRRDAGPLTIVQTYDNRISRFAIRFRDFIGKEVDALTAGGSSAEPQANYLMINQTGVATLNEDEIARRQVDRVVVAEGSVSLPDDYAFRREVYSKTSIFAGKNIQFKAILATDCLEFGRNSAVLHWAHGRKVRMASGCEIKGRLSADEEINLSPDCLFTRLNAPTIRFRSKQQKTTIPHIGAGAPLSAGLPVLLAEADVDESGRWLVNGDLDFPGNSYLKANIIVRGNLVICANARIEGDIKAYGHITLDSGVKVGGSLVSENDISIGKYCMVNGPIATEKAVTIGAQTVIGGYVSPTTVTARTIMADADVIVHGTLWAKEYT